MQVGRALSFNKTPSKLKRAMSSMISPFGSQSNLTPASQLAQMRLASCNNINVSVIMSTFTSVTHREFGDPIFTDRFRLYRRWALAAAAGQKEAVAKCS